MTSVMAGAVADVVRPAAVLLVCCLLQLLLQTCRASLALAAACGRTPSRTMGMGVFAAGEDAG
jgi:hypothetical protein